MRQKSETTKKRSIMKVISYLILAGFLLVLLFFITYKLSHQIYKQNKIDKEVEGLQTEIDRLSQENQDLDGLIAYLQTDDFKEKEVKDKLNLIKEGEQLVLVKEHGLSGRPTQSEKENELQVIVHHANYYYWWHYFFSLEK
ncbi:MAG: septum formation initiator family protein [Patescibacteria group bacterium]|nr:septum formation initiator family protein [Patescibacteria group bacterium]